jgi:hypothetical protein
MSAQVRGTGSLRMATDLPWSQAVVCSIRVSAASHASLITAGLAICLGLGSRVDAQTAPTSVAGAGSVVSWNLRNVSRVESWRFFEPKPGGGDPDYTFVGTRLQAELKWTTRRVDVAVTGQYAGLAGLPTSAVGPGALGTGPLYFTQSGRVTSPQRLYLRHATLRAKNLAGQLDLTVGRQAYASGSEVVTTDAKIEAVRRQRLNARLVGEFEWSLFQRGFDAVRLDWRRPRWQFTAVGASPTQGGFAKDAGAMMRDVFVGGMSITSRGTESTGRRQLQLFVWRYDDDRPVTGRPDNVGGSVAAADVGLTTVGGHWLGARGMGRGEVDTFVWAAWQTGRWYGDDHRAWSVAAELGYQWTAARWTPWIRGGILHASGDDDARDGRHGTFFPMVPTMRRFSQTTAYSTMNLTDQFVQLVLRPARTLQARLDVHRLGLASAADLWYAGSGATLSTGTNFGFVGRPSHGATRLGTTFESSLDWTVRPTWSLNGFAGAIRGGPVVTGTFSGRSLWFAYLESVWRLR